MTNKITITVGIPAHNEESNIANLVSRLINQREKGFVLKKILVVSDGSTDSTVEKAKSIVNSKIEVVSRKRSGKNATLNFIMRNTDSDYLVLLDADVAPKDEMFLSKMFDNKSDLVCAKVIPVSPTTWFESVINQSHFMKLAMYHEVVNKKPVYAGNGRAISLSKNLYKSLVLPQKIVADDAFITLFAIKNDYSIKYNEDTVVYYRSPVNLKDHLKQSTRFFVGQSELEHFFGKDFIRKQYNISKRVTIKYLFRSLKESPIKTSSYIAVFVLVKLILTTRNVTVSHMWETVRSSKSLSL